MSDDRNPNAAPGRKKREAPKGPIRRGEERALRKARELGQKLKQKIEAVTPYPDND